MDFMNNCKKMTSRLMNRVAGAAASALICFCSISCVKTSYEVGGNLIPFSQLFDIYSAEFPLEDINMKMLDSLSGYSDSRITFGAIRDEEFGLTTRGCALSLVPILDTLDFGNNTVFKRFHLNAAYDTTNYADSREANILQNINVYELSEPLDLGHADINTPIAHGTTRITDGTPVYNGKDSLSIDFSKAFAEKFMTMKPGDKKDMETYLSKFPGIYIETDAPAGIGGRINMFQLQLGVNPSYGYLTRDYAELAFSAEYKGERKDTSFLFILSPTQMFSLDSVIYAQRQLGYTSYTFPQGCYNTATHETRGKEGRAKDKIFIEGGGGLKAVISAQEIYDKVREEIARHGNPDEAVINRASIILPFEFPEDYRTMYLFPEYLSPTLRMHGKDEDDNTYVSYASLTDVSSETENPGNINRSLLQYSPDVTYHVQKLVGMSKDVDLSSYDIWTLLMSTETETIESDEDEAYNEYMSALMMQQYYNSLYGYGGYGGYGYGGYGGYGYGYPGYGYGYGGYGGYGYGGYGGYGYSNYMSMYYAAQMASQSSSGTKTSTSIKMDSDRFFKAVLNGPEAENGRVPTLRIIYALPKGE